ncbi:MAG: protein translocase subunit SecD, partial [Propionibacteriales bacterium]
MRRRRTPLQKQIHNARNTRVSASNKRRPARTIVLLGIVIGIMLGVMAATGTWTPRLGLDLRGGTTITLTASNTEGTGPVSQTSLELARGIIQQRVDGLGVGESEVTTQGTEHIVVTVPNVQRDELVRLVGQTAKLSFRAVHAVDMTDAPQPTPSASPSGVPDALPTAPAPKKKNEKKPEADKPRPTAPASPAPKYDELLKYEPTNRDIADFGDFKCGDPFPLVSDQPLLACDKEGREKYLLGPELIPGSMVTDAAAGIPQGRVAWIVTLKFDDQGSNLFYDSTKYFAAQQDPKNRFAIVLDGKVISSPRVQNPIPGGSAEISGSFTQQSANELANVLKYGALPLAFEVSSVENVSAKLGGDQLRAGLIAGLIGLLLVLGYSFLYYRGLGIVVVGSLAVAAALTYCSMVLLGPAIGFALNLPGIAGVIVAIGITADSFIILFERVRDEVRDGRSLTSAIETGWIKARSTILVADMVSLLSAVVLFILA